MAQAKKDISNQSGSVDPWFVMVVVLTMAVLALGSGAVWTYMQWQETRTTVQEQIDEAVAKAKEEQKQKDKKRFAEQQKKPFRTYKAPSILGNITVSFPKNWSLYVVENSSSSELLSATMHPDAVRQVGRDSHDAYALRLTVEGNLYSEEINDYQSKIEEGKLTSRAIKVSGVKGARLDGQITEQYQGRLIILPLRDKTVRIWTESDKYMDDFQKIVDRLKLRP